MIARLLLGLITGKAENHAEANETSPLGSLCGQCRRRAAMAASCKRFCHSSLGPRQQECFQEDGKLCLSGSWRPTTFPCPAGSLQFHLVTKVSTLGQQLASDSSSGGLRSDSATILLSDILGDRSLLRGFLENWPRSPQLHLCTVTQAGLLPCLYLQKNL